MRSGQCLNCRSGGGKQGCGISQGDLCMLEKGLFAVGCLTVEPSWAQEAWTADS